MAKYVNKTQPTIVSVIDFINNIDNKDLTPDSIQLLKLFTDLTGYEPVVWGKIIGFGKYHYTSKSCDADWFITGFSPKKPSLQFM